MLASDFYIDELNLLFLREGSPLFQVCARAEACVDLTR